MGLHPLIANGLMHVQACLEHAHRMRVLQRRAAALVHRHGPGSRYQHAKQPLEPQEGSNLTSVVLASAGVAPFLHVPGGVCGCPGDAAGVAPFLHVLPDDAGGCPGDALGVAPFLHVPDDAGGCGSFQSGVANGPNSAVRSPCAQGEEA